ncbi:MAG: adenosylcobinamide-GDP ribazoletransferase [Acidimicrobiia bacterium]
MGTRPKVSGLRGAFAMLTRVPMGSREPIDHSNDVAWFPVVGALVGAAVAGIYALSLVALPGEIAAVLAVGAGIVLTGAIHEDGLADTADALWGGWSPEKRLEILKDPRIGTYGLLSLTISVLLRVFALATIAPPRVFPLMVGTHSLSRTAVVLGLSWFRPAAEGSGSFYSRSTSSRKAALGLIAGLVIGSATLGLWGIPALGLTVASAVVVGVLARKKLGGITGDILGAIEQTTEISILLLLAAAAA